MELSVLYIGTDKKYWNKLKERFESEYSTFIFNFKYQELSESSITCSMFKNIYFQNIDIFYVDFSTLPDKALHLCKLLTRNNVTRIKPLTSLHKYEKGWEQIYHTVQAGVRLSHFKSFEIHDVIYDALALLDAEKPHKTGFPAGKDNFTLSIKQPLRIGYIQDDLYRIETNSKLSLGSFVELSGHPLDLLSNGKRFYVRSFSNTDLYYNYRFAYELEFTYSDSDFFKATEESWVEYKKYRGNPLGYKADTGKDYREMDKDVKKRKETIRPIREEVRNWLKAHKDHSNPKKLKVLVIDDSLELFDELDCKRDSFPYSLNIQTHLTKGYYQVSRTKPHLIVLKFDEQNNNLDSLYSLIELVKNMEGLDPYILVFNYGDISVSLRDQLEYDNIISYKNEIHLETIKKMAFKLDEKLHLTTENSRAYFRSTDTQSIAFLDISARVVGLTESNIYFISKNEIPMWTTFIVDRPVNMLITIIPHREDSELKRTKGCYRALIHGVGEEEKASLRRLVNKAIGNYR